MLLNLYILNNKTNLVRKEVLNSSQRITIQEYDYILFELKSEFQFNNGKIKFILGNTVLDIESYGIQHNGFYYYYLENENLKSLLPSEDYFTTNKLVTEGIPHRFSRLFINELGNCIPQIKLDNEIYSFGLINIKSPKMDDKNFNLIIEYLMFNNYFDDRILYKNTLDSSLEVLNNSFLESLKTILDFSSVIIDNLFLFKTDPIKGIKTNYRLNEFNIYKELDSISHQWIIDNLDKAQMVNSKSSDYTFSKGFNKYKLNRVIEPAASDEYNVYENRIILGFVLFLIKTIESKKEIFLSKKLRSRNFTNFNEYLISNLHELVRFYLQRISFNFLPNKKFL